MYRLVKKLFYSFYHHCKANWNFILKFSGCKTPRIFIDFIYLILGLLILLDILFPIPGSKPYSKVILARDNSLLTAYLSPDDKWRMHADIEEINPDLIHAITNKEDKWFYYHPGINPVSIAKAMFSNIFSGRINSGASTITMQVARMMEPDNRTYTKKILEMLRALQLEFHNSKDEILSMYLNILPYGGNIEGVKAASYIYFNRPPEKLSLSQSILLSIIPNNPNHLRLDQPSLELITEQRNKWINKFKHKKVFSDNLLCDALEEPVQAKRYTLDKLAPHFCYYLSQSNKDETIHTTLNTKIQRIAEQLLQNHVNRVRSFGVTNGAVLIINNKDNSVSAYCGSTDFWDVQNSGQVNGITAIRSPGSTLKPALYAFAFDKGILTPKMKLQDIPTDFGGYEPENFDLKYNGDVTAEYALTNSLNIPAVQLLQQIGFNDFVDLLSRAGFKEISKNKKSLGLSLILGGCGVSLEQLVRLFTGFSHGGKIYPITFTKSEFNSDHFTELFSKESPYLIAEILSNNIRPDFPNSMVNNSRLPRIAWKTGTSYGKRDAWCVGFTPNYTIGVWLGNFNGKGSPHISGAEMAVPLLFDLFNSIDYNPSGKWFKQPENVQTRKICSETGMLPSENCKFITTDYFIKNKSPEEKCSLYKELYVSSDENIQYCPACLPDSGYHKKYYPIYSPELTLWLEGNNIPFQKPPEHNSNCNALFSDEGPKILSPSKNYEYLVEDGSKQEIMLQAASDSRVKELYWYVNDLFLGKNKPGSKLFFTPIKGKNIITCLDDKGRKSEIFITVKIY